MTAIIRRIYHQLTICNSHDSKDDFRSDCRDVSQCQQQQQNHTNPDDHTQQTTDTPGFTPFTNLTVLWRLLECSLTRQSAIVYPCNQISSRLDGTLSLHA